ncbi:MAG: YncE family protein [Proteobacteria bacterium]|nr:YncE family protein [Pseudomonadota bacterium]MBU1641012.1 YncE family protein [Pseudomonadota bacterium]
MKRTMAPTNKVSQTIWLPALLLLVWAMAACAPLSAVAVNPPLTTEGEVLLFLQPMGEKAAPLKFTLTGVSVRREDGVLIPLVPSTQELTGAERIHSQSSLARARVPAGMYQGLSLIVSQAEIMTEEGPVALQIEQEEIFLPMDMAIPAKKALALFLDFHADKSLESHVLFKPVFSVKTSSQLPLARLGYISMPLANNLLIFHDNSMLLTGVIATGMLPRGMAIDRRRGRLYTALGGDAIEVIDIFQQSTIGTIALWPGDDPQEIALSADGDSLVSANYGSNTVSIMDPMALMERRRVAVGVGPTAVTFSPAGNVAYSMDSLANTLSVIDTRKMALAATIHLEESPLKGALNRTGSELYVITENSPNLLVLDLAGSSAVQKIFIGMGARSILADTRSSLVYVGRRDGEIIVVDPTIHTYIDSIPIGGATESMAISDEGNFLFALVPQQHTLKKVNLVSKEVMGTIKLEGEGSGISLVGAR